MLYFHYKAHEQALSVIYIFLVAKTCTRKKENKQTTPQFTKLISLINDGMKRLFSQSYQLKHTNHLTL